MNRIEEIFLKEDKKLIGFLTAGDPSLDKLECYIQAYIEGGCDLIEIGVPFSDPLADGPVIQAASQRAINQGINLDKIFASISSFRASVNVPLVIMIYFNTILQYGITDFVEKCFICGIDGLIIPDLPFEHTHEITHLLNDQLILIPFATPTSKKRLEMILKDQRGFVYTVTSMGVTGRSSEFDTSLKASVQEVRNYTKLPVALGFGISTVKDVEQVRDLADAVIVGSALVKKIHEHSNDTQVIIDYLRQLKTALTKK